MGQSEDGSVTSKKMSLQFSKQKPTICCINMKQMYLRCDKVSLICFKK